MSNKTNLQSCIVTTGVATIDISKIVAMVEKGTDIYDIYMISGNLLHATHDGEKIYQIWLDQLLEVKELSGRVYIPPGKSFVTGGMV